MDNDNLKPPALMCTVISYRPMPPGWKPGDPAGPTNAAVATLSVAESELPAVEAVKLFADRMAKALSDVQAKDPDGIYGITQVLTAPRSTK